MLIRFMHDLRPALAGNLIAKGHAQIIQRNAPGPTIERGGERAEQKGQPITSFARQKRNEFRGELEPQPLQTITNLSPRPARTLLLTSHFSLLTSHFSLLTSYFLHSSSPRSDT